MQRKQNKAKQARPAKQKTKKRTPFADTAEILGGAAGGMLNNMFKTNLDFRGPARWLGSGIGSIFGSGDYTVVGAHPENNVLFNQKQIPKFSTSRATNVVCHREYLRDWSGVSSFSNEGFALNPGNVETFPWLSSIAQNYQQYKFHGIIFEFKPLITDYISSGAPGVVIMATNYNAAEPLYQTKQEMENSEFAVSVKPTHNLVHGIECAIDETSVPIKYVRTGSLPVGQDARLYDLGVFQFANQGSPTQLLGEIWVSYCVEFFKPVQPETPGGITESSIMHRSAGNDVVPLGTTLLDVAGNIDMTATTGYIDFDAIPNARYLISICWEGGTNSVNQMSTASTGLSYIPKMLGASGLLNNTSFTSTSLGCTVCNLTTYVKCTLDGPGRVRYFVNNDGNVPTNSRVTISVTKVDQTLFP